MAGTGVETAQQFNAAATAILEPNLTFSEAQCRARQMPAVLDMFARSDRIVD
jgi:hypothetical protein